MLAVVAGLVAANMLGVAAAEAPTGTTPVRTVSVQGVAEVPIPQNANRETADAVYRQGMAAALSDGQGKAEFLAGKAGVTLGSVQSIGEGGGSIECSAKGLSVEGEERYERSFYEPYEGEQPDFGSARSSTAVAPQPAAAATPTRKKTKAKPKPTAKKASPTVCTLSASVSLVYAIG